jgi:CRISPR/Cas system-associated exonuclease Cas4 (RecB family)
MTDYDFDYARCETGRDTYLEDLALREEARRATLEALDADWLEDEE